MSTSRSTDRTMPVPSEHHRPAPWPRPLRGIVAAGTVAAAVAAGTTTSAFADAETFQDAAGDTGTRSDVTTVVVRNGGPTGSRVFSSADVGNLRVGDRTTFWIDTRRANPGPEFRVVALPNTDGFTLEKVNSWQSASPSRACRGLRVRADAGGPDTVSVSVPRRCVGRPDRVRISVEARFRVAKRVVVDWAPGRHQWFGWVRK